MSSDSEICPSPLPSPIFARCSPARGTVARKCREFYLKRLERTAMMQKRWSICDFPQENLQEVKQEDQLKRGEEQILNPEEMQPQEGVKEAEDESRTDPTKDSAQELEAFPLRKCRSSFDLAMDSLRKEISSLIAQDNDLFRQLLSLHDSIAELRERQRHSIMCMDDDDEEYIDLEDTRNRSRDSNSPSLESLSDPGEIQEISPESTLSSRSSLSATSTDFKPHYSRCNNHRSRCRKSGNSKEVGKQHHHHHRTGSNPNSDSRPIVFIDKSEICFRCRKLAPPYRRSSSISSLYYLHEDMESYDSGIHLQGSHSDSDHEIFV